MDDEKIIGLFFERSEAAILELDGKYGPVFRKISMNIVHNRQDSEECVNDAYLAAWNKIPPERPSRLMAYVCKIVRNISMNRYYRENAKKRNAAYTAAMEELERLLADSKTVESELEAQELTGMIEEFLNTLSTENRVIFLRRYWFADSLSEISARIGISQKAVSVRLARIRQKLRNYLEVREVNI